MKERRVWREMILEEMKEMKWRMEIYMIREESMEEEEKDTGIMRDCRSVIAQCSAVIQMDGDTDGRCWCGVWLVELACAMQ